MEADWDEVRWWNGGNLSATYLRFATAQINRVTIPPETAHDLPTPASALAFDTQQELLWLGNEYVSSRGAKGYTSG